MRVWELAKQLRIPTVAVIDLLRAEGEYVTSHFNHVPGPLVETIIANAPPPSKTATDYEPRPPTKAELAAWAEARKHWDTARRRGRRRRPGPRRITLSQPWDGDDYYDPDEDFRTQEEATTRDIVNYAGVKAATVRQWVKRGYITPIRKERGTHVFNTDDFLKDLSAIHRRRRDKSRPQPRNRHDTSRRRSRLTFVEFDTLNRVHPNKAITLTEAAEITGLATATLRSWIYRGHLHTHPTSRPRATKTTVGELYAAVHRTR